MAHVYVVSLKVGTSHGLWQYKTSGTHERVMMHGLRDILTRTCELLGFDSRDRSIIYLLSFSAEPFEGYHVCLERIRQTPTGCYYRVEQSRIGSFTATGLFPAIFNTLYLRLWPESIYFKLEKSLTGGIAS
ncbi:MAG TPA: hypothetical protein VL354_12475 [Spirochaetia bacterium]|nr:hypothetical protein [Spirochaetia bacterium]